MSDRYLTDAKRNALQRLTAAMAHLDLDEPTASLTFTARLRREQYGWSPAYAQRVAEEYRRFLILAALTEEPVTPSEAVDQAWHLHIVYTHSYHEWCDALFGRYLHHGPTKGGKAEGDRFAEQYNATLALYELVFGQAPPRDIWPPAEIRFNPKQLGTWLQTSAYWLIPRRRVAQFGSLIVLLAAAVALLFVTNHFDISLFEDGYAQSSGSSGSGDSGNDEMSAASGILLIVIFGGVMLLLIYVMIHAAARGSISSGDQKSSGSGFWFDGGGGSGCSSHTSSHGHSHDGGHGDGHGDGGSGCGSGCGGGGCGGGCGS